MNDKISVGFISACFTAVAVFVGAVITIDSRYAHAGDFADLKIQQERAIQTNRNEVRYAVDQLRKQTVEDKIFEIELVPVPKRSMADNARLEKFKRDVSDINQRWSTK